MDNLLDKISSYNIFNYLFPGAVFVVLMQWTDTVTLPDVDIVTKLLIYYFVGLTISRVGSVILEPLLKVTRFVRYSDYSAYITACGQDAKIETLLEVSNTYRTLAATFLIALAIRWSGTRIDLSVVPYEAIILAALALLFLFSFRKQAGYISRRVTHHARVD
jgi:hypothetical protein